MDKATFYDKIKLSLFHGNLTQSQVDGMEAILNNADTVCTNELAYILATIFHETAKTMQPIEEYGKGRNRIYGHAVKQNGQAYNNTKNIFYGRGFVQLTWYENYERMGKLMGVDLINHPELALQLDIATKICFEGMIKGLFTGKKLKDYFTSTPDFVNARKIINRLDCAELIAGYAHNFLKALS